MAHLDLTARGGPPVPELPGVPQRELRLVIDGVGRWLDSLADPSGKARPLGRLRGESGRGQREILAALRGVCRRAGMLVVHARAFAGAAGPPGLAGDLVRQLLDGLGVCRAPAAENAPEELAPDVIAALYAITPGLGTRGGGDGNGPAPLARLGTSLDRSRTVDAVARAFLEVASRRPLVVVFEDIDAADALSHEVFLHLRRMLCLRLERGDLPRLLLVVSTADEAGEDPPVDLDTPDDAYAYAFDVEARGYSRADLNELARALVGESVSLRQREALLRETGGRVRPIRWVLWELAERSEAGESADWSQLVRARFPELVRRRWSRLDELDQRLLRGLAVLGRSSIAAVIRHVAGTDAELAEVVSALGRLHKRGWVVRRRARNGRGVDEFAIADPGVAGPVLEAVTLAERRELEASAVEALEAASEYDARWLPHALRFRLAAELTLPPDGVSVRALEYLQSIGCAGEALEVLDEALAGRAAVSREDRAAWKRWRAQLLESTGAREEAAQEYGELGSQLDEPEQRAECSRRRGDLLGELGRWDDRFAAYGEALSQLEGEGESLERLKVLASLARAHLAAEKREHCREVVGQCVAWLESHGLATDDDYLEILRLAREVNAQGVPGLDQLDREVDRHRRRTDLRSAFYSLRRLAQIERLRGNPDAAERYLREALVAARESGARALVALARQAVGEFRRERGARHDALSQLEAARAIFRDLGDVTGIHRVESRILPLQLEVGDVASACRIGLNLAESWPETEIAAATAPFPALAEAGASLDRGELERAVSLAEDVLRESRRREATPEYEGAGPAALLLDGRAAALRGEYDQALVSIQRSLSEQGRRPDVRALLAAYGESAGIFLQRAELARSYRYLIRALRLALDYRSTPGALGSYVGLVQFLGAGSAVSDAGRLARGALRLCVLTGELRQEIPLRLCLARAAIDTRDLSEAEEELDQAERLVERLDLPVEMGGVLRERGWLAHLAGDWSDALGLARRGVELARGLGLQPLLDEFLHLVGVVESAQENPSKNFLRALEALEQALAGADHSGRPRLRWEVLQAMARIYDVRGKRDFAAQYLERAEADERRVFGDLPPELRWLRWRSRVAGASDVGAEAVRVAASAPA